MDMEREAYMFLNHDWPNIVMAKHFGILDNVLDIKEKK